MRQLAVALQRSRQTISNWLDRWPDFPVLDRGANGREYQFDVATVVAFLREKQEEQRKAGEERDQELAQLVLPLIEADQAPAAATVSIKDQVEAMKLNRMRREEAERLGKLVEADAVTMALTGALQNLSRMLGSAVRQAGRDHNLPDPVIRALEHRIGEAQRNFVREAASYLKPDDTEMEPQLAIA